ncbi:MarR family transcriptional regulator [Streptomyces sp. GMY02]|uniref:MarR family winged helix-turn-helix transcriptional regulator n=1 Tax=Streptomyces sp. GMY02 TaxID=1333528 RepID=UPI001C2C3C83|nr:MarR family transcriptional regulator [Streptomyces sp. GMY02]QXE38758.1 MarR family transcriptional regulator [Streptomyces sp. GMY02]
MAADKGADSEDAHVEGDGLRWLDQAEKEAWTGVLSLAMLLPGRLESPLRREHGITLFEYLVLSHMSEAPQRRLRMGDLAYLAGGSPSRLSNVMKRFERRAWVERFPDPGNGRYILATLTEEGFSVVRRAAPTHLRAVRGMLLDRLSVADQKALTRIAEKLQIRPVDFL